MDCGSKIKLQVIVRAMANDKGWNGFLEFSDAHITSIRKNLINERAKRISESIYSNVNSILSMVNQEDGCSVPLSY